MRRLIADDGDDVINSAGDIMNGGVTCVGEDETLTAAALYMRDLTVFALPICGDDDGVRPMITDRDIAIKFQADGMDSATTTAGQLAQDNTNHIEAGASAEEMPVRCVSAGWRPAVHFCAQTLVG